VAKSTDCLLRVDIPVVIYPSVGDVGAPQGMETEMTAPICCDCESPIDGAPSEEVLAADGVVLRRHARCGRPRCPGCGWLVSRDANGAAACLRCGTHAPTTSNMRLVRRVPLAQVHQRLRHIGATVTLCGPDTRGLPEAAVQEMEAFAIRLKAKARR
jgi:hypothetical protein